MQSLIQRGAIQIQCARKLIGGDFKIGNLLRIDQHGIGRQGLGQRLPGAVQNRPAQGLHFYGFLLLLFGQPEQLVVADNLQPDQTAEDDAGPRQQHPQQPLQDAEWWE